MLLDDPRCRVDQSIIVEHTSPGHGDPRRVKMQFQCVSTRPLDLDCLPYPGFAPVLVRRHQREGGDHRPGGGDVEVLAPGLRHGERVAVRGLEGGLLARLERGDAVAVVRQEAVVILEQVMRSAIREKISSGRMALRLSASRPSSFRCSMNEGTQTFTTASNRDVGRLADVNDDGMIDNFAGDYELDVYQTILALNYRF